MNQMISLVVLGCISCCLAQVPSLGRCPDVQVKQDFEPSKYLGKWYEAERYFAVFQLGGKCVSATYTQADDGSITVFNKQINSVTGRPSNITGKAVAKDPSVPAKLTVTFPNSPEGSYWVIDTDYDNFAVVYSCTPLAFANVKFSWILTRQQNPSQETLNAAYAVADKNGIKRSLYMKTNQSNCPEGY